MITRHHPITNREVVRSVATLVADRLDRPDYTTDLARIVSIVASAIVDALDHAHRHDHQTRDTTPPADTPSHASAL